MHRLLLELRAAREVEALALHGLRVAAGLLGEDEGMERINTFFGAEGCIHTEFKRLDSYAIHQYMVTGI